MKITDQRSLTFTYIIKVMILNDFQKILAHARYSLFVSKVINKIIKNKNFTGHTFEKQKIQQEIEIMIITIKARSLMLK